MPLCYRVKSWNMGSVESGLTARIEATTHPADTTLPRLFALAFPEARITMAGAREEWAGFHIGREAEFRVEDWPSDFEAFLDLLSKVITVCDACDVSHCIDLYRTPVETADSPEDWPYTRTGNLIYKAKYWRDEDALVECGKLLLDVARRHPCLRESRVVCAMPPSSDHGDRPDLPARWADILSESLSSHQLQLARTRPVSSQKGMAEAEKRKANQSGSMLCQEDLTGKSVLVLDDLYMSGETLAEAVRALRAAGADRVYALCGAKTAKGAFGLAALLEG